jgi:hypothetical protein
VLTQRLCRRFGGCGYPVLAFEVISAPYTLLNVPNAFGTQRETLPLGWYADVAGNLNRAIAVVGEISGNYKSFEETETQFGVNVRTDVDLNIHTFLGGVRFNDHRRANDIVQGLRIRH